MRYYNVDLRYALWGAGWRGPNNPNGKIGYRRLCALAYGLPPDSAVVRDTDPEMAGWRESEPDLLALNAELTDGLYRLFASAHGAKGLHDPLKISRPWEDQEPPQKASSKDLLAFIARHGGMTKAG